MTAAALRLRHDDVIPTPRRSDTQIQLYRMLDAPDADKAAVPVHRAEAPRWNTPELGYGIFLAVNAFVGARRRENLARINAAAVDMDHGTKYQQADRLHSSPLVPTSIVETKRGYQAYWRVSDMAPEQWNAIVLERLVPYFGADPNARDLCRILRAPGFLHLKDPSAPFLCQIVFRSIATYRAAELLEAFPHVPPVVAAMPARPTKACGDDFWTAVYNLDCHAGLDRLSGHPAVGGERFTFRRAPRDHLNIFVDGKGTSCFLDENRRIGSSSKGGPTLYQWLSWYGNSPAECVRVLKELFPELKALR